MKSISRFLHGWADLIRLPQSLRRLRLPMASVSLLLALALPFLFYTQGARWLPARFWQLLGLCSIALGVLWWFLVGARRLSRRGFARKQIGDLAPGDATQEQAALALMRQSIRQAKQTIQRSPDIERGRDPLYRIPWLLFLGERPADVDGLLRTATQVSPFPAPPAQAATSLEDAASGTAPLWQWWFFKSMIAIQASPVFVCEPEARRERGLWYAALQQLAQEREKLPLNGIAVCLDARTLLGGPAAVKPLAIRLRRLVDEALEHLHVQPPVYLIVTGLEQLQGYETFRAILPADTLRQALGHCLPEADDAGSAGGKRLDELFDPIADRLHALRLGALRNQTTPAGRHGLFGFVEQFIGLRAGLHALVQLMLEDNPFQRTPRWRGLYFTASAREDRGGAFVDDLFTRFLPADQPLAATNFKGQAARLGMAGIGVAAMLGLSFMISHSLQGARQDDSTLLAQTRSACREPSDAGASSRIAWVARCGQTVQQLEAAQADTGLGFGLRRADQSIARTKQTLLRDFSNLILAPYDQVIEADLARGQTTVEHVLAISQRLRLLDNCRQAQPECRAQELAHNTAFDPQARVFSPFISGEQDGGSSRHHAAALFTTYLGYLRWQSPSVLDAEAQRLQGVLASLLAANPPSVEQLQRWADARRDALQLKDLWLPEGRIVGTELPAQVPAAFSQTVWRDYVAPMLQTAAAASQTHRPALNVLRERYLQAYMQAWGRFSAAFDSGLTLWQGAYDQLLPIAAQPEHNPYQRLDAVLRTELLPLPLQLPLGTQWALAWSEAKDDWLGAWRPLSRFIGQAAASLSNGLTSPWWTAAKVPAAPWIPAWLESSVALRDPQLRHAQARAWLLLSQPARHAEVYQATAALYRSSASGKVGASAAAGPAQDYALLLQASEQPPEHYASQFTSDDLQAWSMVQGPSRLLLFLAMQHTAQYLQTRWHDHVYTPLHTLAPRPLQERLYGPGGQLAAFVKDWLSPFITEGERAPIPLAGVQLPLSPAFAGLLAGERQFDPSSQTRPFPAAQIQFQGPSRFGSLNEGVGGTQLEIVCQDRSFQVTSQGESLADGRVQVFWAPQACQQARLRIALPEQADAPDAIEGGTAAAPAASGAGPRLTLLYQGQDILPTLLRQFRSGARTFRLAEFQASYTPAQWAQLQPHLRTAGLTQVRVLLQITPTPEMERHLARGAHTAGLPDRLFDL